MERERERAIRERERVCVSSSLRIMSNDLYFFNSCFTSAKLYICFTVVESESKLGNSSARRKICFSAPTASRWGALCFTHVRMSTHLAFGYGSIIHLKHIFC